MLDYYIFCYNSRLVIFRCHARNIILQIRRKHAKRVLGHNLMEFVINGRWHIFQFSKGKILNAACTIFQASNEEMDKVFRFIFRCFHIVMGCLLECWENFGCFKELSNHGFKCQARETEKA